jgi:hypothetical protein
VAQTSQGRENLEDEDHISQPRMVRTEHKIQEFATLVHPNLSKMVDEVAAAPAAGISHGHLELFTWNSSQNE